MLFPIPWGRRVPWKRLSCGVHAVPECARGFSYFKEPRASSRDLTGFNLVEHHWPILLFVLLPAFYCCGDCLVLIIILGLHYV